MTLPSLESLGADLGLEMERVSAGLGGLAFAPPLVVQRAPDALFAPLKHPLSGAYVELNGPRVSIIRSDAERDALDWLENQSSPLPSSKSDSFFEVLEALNRRATGGGGGWRRGEIGTAHDPRGNSIRFPPVSCVHPQLEQLRHLLADGGGERPALFTAAMALVLLTNCHPFRDGNGRVGRVLFNHVLRQHGGMGRDVYIPLYELAARSEGGYLIALRLGELRGEWEPLMGFVMKLLGVYRGLVDWERRMSNG